jgi:pimeloyl-ACP methyl ester carboxylesterase
VALVHGSMDRSAAFAKAARRLDGDLRVVRYDRRGYGRSAGVGPPFGMDAQVADLLAVLHGRRATVVGHSYGGAIALATAATHPEVVAAVGVYEMPMPWAPWWPDGTAGGAIAEGARRGDSPEEGAEMFMRRMVGDAVWERLPPSTRAARRAEGPALVGELVDVHLHAPFERAAVGCPVLVARGEHAGRHHLEGSAVLAGWFATEELVIPDAGHGGHASSPDAFAAFVRAVVRAGSAA